MSTDKAKLSLGKTKKVCGYEIKQMPLGAYLKALERVKTLPEDFLATCFPGQSLQQILDSLTSTDETTIKALLFSAVIAAPKYIIGLLSEITGIDEDTLLSDDNIGAAGAVELADAVIEVNRLGECVSGIKRLLGMMRKQELTDTGFKA